MAAQDLAATSTASSIRDAAEVEAASAALCHPMKLRDYHSHHFNAAMWDHFKPREGDIIVATAYKSGTTWMQQIISELIFGGGPVPAAVPDISPWVDLRVPPPEVKMPMIESMTHRRFLKTHLPADGIEFFPQAKYIYVGRDGRDVFMSFCKHYETANAQWYGALNDAPGLVGPPLPNWHEEGFTPATLFDQWISKGWDTFPWETDGWPWWSLFHNVRTWWQCRQQPNILFVHFNNLKADLPGQMRRIAAFLDIPIDEEKFPTQVEHCTFEYMKARGDQFAPVGGAFWHLEGQSSGGGAVFVNKGTNGRWRDVLSEEQVAKYDEVVREKLTPECAAWLETGQIP